MEADLWTFKRKKGGGGGGGGRETYGSMLTGVASLMAESTGGVMSQLSVRPTYKEHRDHAQNQATQNSLEC